MTRLSVMRTTFTNRKKVHWTLMAACPTKGHTSCAGVCSDALRDLLLEDAPYRKPMTRAGPSS